MPPCTFPIHTKNPFYCKIDTNFICKIDTNFICKIKLVIKKFFDEYNENKYVK